MKKSLPMAAILALLLVAASVAGAAETQYAINMHATDTIFKGAPTMADTGSITVVTIVDVGDATDTVTVADSLKIGTVPATRADRGYWRMSVYWNTDATDTLTRSVYINHNDIGGTRRTTLVQLDTSETGWNELTMWSTKVWQVICIGRAANDSFGVRAQAPLSVVPMDSADQWTLERYTGLAQDTILPRERGTVGKYGTIWANAHAACKPGYGVGPNAAQKLCSVKYADPDSGWTFGYVKENATAAGLVRIVGAPRFIPKP